MEVVLITAIWCPSCIIMRPRYNKIIKDLGLSFSELDFDDDEKEIDKYSIGKTLPVCIIMKDKNELLRIVGEKSEKELNKLFQDIKLC